VSAIDEEFTWPRAHKLEFLEPELKDKRKATAAFAGEDAGRIVQRGSGFDLLRPLSAAPDLCLKFAALDHTPSACFGFAGRWGLLREPADKASHRPEPLTDWYMNIAAMSESIKNIKKGPIVPADYVIGQAEIVLRPGPDRFMVRVRPANLLSALWLQLGQLLGQGQLLTCDHCGNWFSAGSGGRRRIARFCSTTCKNAWHNARRAAG
jgi:hypothetical protein